MGRAERVAVEGDDAAHHLGIGHVMGRANSLGVASQTGIARVRGLAVLAHDVCPLRRRVGASGQVDEALGISVIEAVMDASAIHLFGKASVADGHPRAEHVEIASGHG